MEGKRLIPGIYEEIVDRGLQHTIQNDAGQDCDCGKLEKALAPKALSQYVAGLLEQKLSEIADTDGKEAGKEQLRLVNQVIAALGEEEEHAIPEQEQAKQLLSVEDRVNTGKEVAKTRKPPVRPGTSIAASSLFTGAAHEPPMYLELSREAASADRIDMLVSFVKWSGLRLLYGTLLCPFQYFGLADDTDLRQVRWTRGGYDQAELSKLYTFAAGVAQKRVERILWELNRIVTDLDDVKGLGFCVSKEHAAFMSRQFNEHGIPSLCLISESDQKVRDAAKEELVGGKIHFIFVVDLYNEIIRPKMIQFNAFKMCA